jgi:hypothetical protein
VVLLLDAPTTTSFVPEIVVEVPTLTLFEASLPMAPDPLGGFCDGPLYDANAVIVYAEIKTTPASMMPAVIARIPNLVRNVFCFIKEFIARW